MQVGGPPAGGVCNATRHSPSGPAVAVGAAPQLAVTVTLSPASAQPQTGAVVSIWITMLPAKSRAGLTSADAEIDTAASIATGKRSASG